MIAAEALRWSIQGGRAAEIRRLTSQAYELFDKPPFRLAPRT